MSTKCGCFDFNYGWKFLLADSFPLSQALNRTKDKNGLFFYEEEYDDNSWAEVTVPHTYNDADLFVYRIEDEGSNQKRTFALYRKWFDSIDDIDFKKVIFESEGIRQTAYVYVNGKMAGYIESGVAPFGFDITGFVHSGKQNLIAIATDSTSTRGMDLLSAETPQGGIPGSYLHTVLKESLPIGCHKGIPYFWNCNDFNPCIGGLNRNLRLYVKNRIYITLPLYSNLRTVGCYVYADNINILKKQCYVNIEVPVKNESKEPVEVYVKAVVSESESGRILGEMISEKALVPPAPCKEHELSIIPKEAYIYENGEYIENDETRYSTEIFTKENRKIVLSGEFNNIRFWNVYDPFLYDIKVSLFVGNILFDEEIITTGFRKTEYKSGKGLLINDEKVWLTGYAQRASNEWAAIGCAVDWLKEYDACLIRESNANHIRFMHVAAAPADIRSYDCTGIICTQPAGDKERENFNRQWMQRMEAMRDVIIFFRNSPSIVFWEAGNNSINAVHMRMMRDLKRNLDPFGGRFMGCRTINEDDVLEYAEYVGTMLNRHAAPFIARKVPITETEYLREESPRRVWDDYTPPDFDYDNRWLGKGGKKMSGSDAYDLTAEDFALSAAKGYSEFFNDRLGGASKRDMYTAAAALCWTDSAQHGRQSYSENGRMSGRVDPVRIKKQSFEVFKVLQSETPALHIVGHWNYPKEDGTNYKYPIKEYDGTVWQKNGEYGFRNPKEKTVYVIGSYSIAYVELYINGEKEGACDTPTDSFVFAFERIDVTKQGIIEAKGYDYSGKLVAEDSLVTANNPSKINLKVYTGSEGLIGDGADVAFIDVCVCDEEDNVCPLYDGKIEFEIEGDAHFLGGYNSGKFDGHGKNDSVIHKPYVFAECGINRVFIRAGKSESDICLSARTIAFGVEISNSVVIHQSGFIREALAKDIHRHYVKEPTSYLPKQHYVFDKIPAADKAKYKKPDKVLCKVLINGQEPNTYGNLSIVEHESIFSPVIPILESLKKQRPDILDFSYSDGCLEIKSGENVLVAKAGYTHLSVNGCENLMGGQPFVNEDGFFFMEINAIAGYLSNITAGYDDKVNVFRIEY